MKLTVRFNVNFDIWLTKVGISSPEKRVTTYKEFERDVLPRIKDLGYNTIQM